MKQALRSFGAEFLKIWAFKLPLFGILGIAVYVILVSVDLVAAEHLTDHVKSQSAISMLPVLAWASWGKLYVLPFFLIGFATYCTVVDCQYGMVPIGCSQPQSRRAYLGTKTVAILAHVCIFCLMYVLFLIAASAAIGRSYLVTSVEAIFVLKFAFRLVLFCAGVTWLVIAAAALRRTLLAGFVTALLAVICAIWLNVLPPTFGLRPYLIFRYFLYPLAPIWPHDWTFIDLPNASATTMQFLFACLVVPAACWLAAVTYFERRDVTE